jgi:hypothetical protein
MGSLLLIMSTADGSIINQFDMDSVPVFDGMSAADGKVFISSRNGSLACYE